MRPRQLLLRLLQALEAAPVFAAAGLLQLLPYRAAAAVGGVLARTIGPLLPIAKVARRHVAMCLPETSAEERAAILRAMWDNFGRIAGEFTHRRALWDPTLKTAADRYGVERLQAAAAA